MTSPTPPNEGWEQRDWALNVVRDGVGLDAREFMVLMVLLAYRNHETNETFVSQETVAERMGKDVRSTRRAIKALVDAGVVVVEEQGGRRGLSTKSSRYSFHAPNRTHMARKPNRTDVARTEVATVPNRTDMAAQPDTYGSTQTTDGPLTPLELPISTPSSSSSVEEVTSVTREEDDVMEEEAATEQEANFVPPALEEGEVLPGMFKRALLQPVAEEFKDWTPDRLLAERYRTTWRDVKAQADEKNSKVRVVHIDYAIHYARTQATIGLTAPNVALSKDPAVHFATATSTARREATNALAKPIPARPLPDPEPRERFREVNPF